jgi:ankyrin repeat protein
MFVAIDKGHLHIVKYIVAHYSGINDLDQDNRTALIRASMDGKHEIVEALLMHPFIDVNYKDLVS